MATGDSDSGADDLSAACEAADKLPRPGELTGQAPAGKREQQVMLAIAVVTFVGCGGGLLIALALQPLGLLPVLGGLPAWLAIRVLFVRMRGGQSGVVTVDGDGLVHVPLGRSSVRRLQNMFDVGAGPWMRHSILAGLAVGILAPVVLGVSAVALDAPWLAMLIGTTLAWGMLDCSRIFVAIARVPEGHTKLDSSMLLPALALYARHHGWESAVSGVRADDLATTLAEHPDDVAAIQHYGTVATALAGLAQRMGGVGGTGL